MIIVAIPQDVLEALEMVRESAACNMLDVDCVLVAVLSFQAEAWLREHRAQWMDIMNEFGRWSRQRKQASG